MHEGLSRERYSFRGFDLDVSAYELRSNGHPIRLERQPMDLLILLVERRGELVGRNDIVARLWAKDVFVDVDTGINTAVRKVRLALGDSAETPAFVETVSGKGYRFIAPVDGSGFAPARAGRPRRAARVTVLGAVAGLAFLATLAAGLGLWLRHTPAHPRLTGTTQITSDLVAKFGPVTDGTRLYFNTLPRAGVSTLSQVAAAGGDVAPIAVPLETPVVVDVSPDGKELLVTGRRAVLGASSSPPELWTVPVVGGAPHRVGDVRACDASWSLDGRSVTYTTCTNAIYVASVDGSGSRKVWTAPGQARWPSLSPDGRRLRFTVFPKDSTPSLWEVSTDGRDAHPLMPGFEPPACCGRWSPDGKYYVFDAYDRKHGTPDVWVLLEKTSWLARVPTGPVRLTQGPIKFHNPYPSRDGRKIFALGVMERGELVRRVAGSGQLVPFLGGISAYAAEFSRDGRWVAYVAYPDGMLWRSRVDGSDRLQLTRPPLNAGGPPSFATGVHWSPDGKRLVFLGTLDLKVAAYFVSAEGGAPEVVPVPDDRGWVPRSWSADGRSLAFGHPGAPASAIQVLDVQTGRFSKLPGSEGLTEPVWSPDGRILAALSSDGHRLHLLDVASQKWRETLSAKERLAFPSWSPDGRALFISQGSTRIRLWAADGRRETIASLEGVQRPSDTRDWVGHTPDGSLITLRDLSVQEIFALDWEAP
jgi:Tol biopolymer transport system component/DNA-binding winged helix-turn-helix (wHTH) protein